MLYVCHCMSIRALYQWYPGVPEAEVSEFSEDIGPFNRRSLLPFAHHNTDSTTTQKSISSTTTPPLSPPPPPLPIKKVLAYYITNTAAARLICERFSIFNKLKKHATTQVANDLFRVSHAAWGITMPGGLNTEPTAAWTMGWGLPGVPLLARDGFMMVLW